MRQLAPPLHPVAEALSFGAATARAEYAARQPVESYRANVDRSRVVAHASFRNVFLVTTLEDVRTDVCLLWPRAVDVDDVRFVDATTGAPLPDAALRTTTFRRWLDGEVRLSVAGVDVSVCDPTGCLPRGWW